jgi:hypothetical protein
MTSKRVTVKGATDPKTLHLDETISQNLELKKENETLKAEISSLISPKWKPMKDAPRDKVILTDKGLVMRAVFNEPGEPYEEFWFLCDINGSLKHNFGRRMRNSYIPEMEILRSTFIGLGLSDPPELITRDERVEKKYHSLIVEPTMWRDI